MISTLLVFLCLFFYANLEVFPFCSSLDIFKTVYNILNSLSLDFLFNMKLIYFRLLWPPFLCLN